MISRSRLQLYIQLTRLKRPIGILLLLWPTLWAVWIAGQGHPTWHIVGVFILGTILMRSAGCVINDYVDRDIDKHVKRTRERPITSGQVAPKEALLLAAGLAFIALLLVLTLNTLTLLLSIRAILLAASYPYTKRFLVIPQAYLGIAFSFGIPMAFAAQLNTVPEVAWWLVLANLFWVIAYDTEYAMVDRDDDIHLGIHSSALLFGKYDVVAVMICYGATLNILVMVGQMLEKGWIYYVGLAVATAIAVYHFTLIQHRKREDCFKAFLHNTWFGMAIFGGILWDYGR